MSAPKPIYTWLRVGVVDGNRNLILENNKLKKEIEQLYKLLGRATAELNRLKRLTILEEVDPGWRRHFARHLGIGRTSL